MAELKLNNRQAALILEVSEGGEVKVEVAAGHSEDGDNDLAAAICKEIATKLVNDEQFQEEILAPLYEDDGYDGFGNAP